MPRGQITVVWGLACVLAWDLASQAAAAADPVRVRRIGNTVEIDNGLVRGRFTSTADDGVEQEYDARRGSDWVLAAKAYRPAKQPVGRDSSSRDSPIGIPPLYDTAVDPGHRLLVSECLDEVAVGDEEQGRATVTLRGQRGGTAVEQTVEVRSGERSVHVQARATLDATPPRLEYLLLPFVAAIDGRPESSHAPSYQPTADSIVGDRAFFSPLASVQQESLFVGVVPDVESANRHAVFAAGARQHPDSNAFPVAVDPSQVTMPTGLSLLLPQTAAGCPIIGFGLIDSIVHQHVWFEHPQTPGAMVRELASRNVAIELDLLLDADAPRFRGHEAASRHLWKRFGHDTFMRPRPQAMPLADYAAVCYSAHAAYQGYEVAGETLRHRDLPEQSEMRCWQEWETDGTPVGGFRLHAPQWFDFIAYLGWWNNACDATGLYSWGTRTSDPALVDKARRIVSLAVSAPQDGGLFPGIYDLRGKRWIRSLWAPPREGYDPTRRDAYWNWTETSAYQTAAASVTAGYLMQYRRSCESDPRILPFVRRYGDFLVAAMGEDGCVPAWYDAACQPLPSLAKNADGGSHAWVLAELFLATRDERYLTAARRAATFLEREVMPHRRWTDFETLYSCAIKPETFYDERTGQGPCNTMSMSWALQGFLTLHEATGERRFLEAAESVADSASLFQAAWAPKFVVTAYPFGGVSSQLGDAEWLDQRAHRFADPFARIGLLMGRNDLVERGVAAARSSLTLTSHPRHRVNDIYTHTDFPTGLGPENVDHEGFPQRPLSSGPSWGAVGGLAGAAHLLDRLGGATIDVERGIAVGVDGVVVTRVEFQAGTLRVSMENSLAALPVPYEAPWEIELRLAGLPAGRHDLVINDQPPVRLVFADTTPTMVRLRIEGTSISTAGEPDQP